MGAPKSQSDWMGHLEDWIPPKGIDKWGIIGFCACISRFGYAQNGVIEYYPSEQTLANNNNCSTDKVGKFKKLAIQYGFLKPTGRKEFGVPVLIRWIPDNPIQEPVKAKPEVSQPKAAEVAKPAVNVATPVVTARHDNRGIWPSQCPVCMPRVRAAKGTLTEAKWYPFMDNLKAEHDQAVLSYVA